MTPDDYRWAGNLFDQLRDLPEDQRAAALDAACAGNAELRAQVVRLLEADRNAASGSFLERRAIEDAARLLIPEAPNLPSSGTLIGNYRLGPRIGAGGMGVVFEGEDLRLHRRVAIKVLPLPFAAEGGERIRRFQREARAVSLLNHPNIVSIFDADFDQGHYYIAMEFVEGQTLRQLIASESRPLDAKTILDLIGQTGSALSAAHEAGVVHRDIKPENIMVRPDGFVKVLDFGLAKLLEPSSNPDNGRSDLRTRPGNLAGTIQYLSPEQILGERVGPRGDLFSLGVVAYELATGVRPFDGPTEGAVFNAILNHTPPAPSAVRPALGNELDGLIIRALEKDPELRFQTAVDLRSSCQRLARDYIVKTLERDRDIGQQHAAGPRAGLTPVEGGAESGRASAALSVPGIPAHAARVRRFSAMPAVAVALVAALGGTFFWLTRPLPLPLVTGVVQITRGGRPKAFFVNDGTRLYYAAGKHDPDMQMFQVSTKGGEPVPMARLTGMFPLDISPDRSEMLLGQFQKGTPTAGPYAVWVADTLGSAPRRLGDLTASFARFSPKGDEILYTLGSELRIARSDGSESRIVARVKGIAKFPAWSPDGRSIRFTLEAKGSLALWEVEPDGTHLHALFPERADQPHAEGVWTPNGKYFVFAGALRNNTLDLWAIGQSRRLLETTALSPARLTTGPMIAHRPQASPDGHRIFFLGGLNQGELVRYDGKSNQWTPFLGGLAAMQLDYSRDGKWVTYASCPEGSIWRSAVDGSERLQLTAPPLFARNPRWSPDGSQITFYGGLPGKPDRVYIVSANGGAAQQLTHGEGGPGGDDDGSWSSDGASLVYGAQSADQHADQRDRLALNIIDVNTQRITKLPGSNGLWSARWSPDGRYIAALGFPNKLWLYNVATREKTQVTNIGAGFPSWSRDSLYIYFEDNATTVWSRVRIKDGKMERLTKLTGLKTVPSGLGWVGLTPDGSLISTRDAGSTEIYALDWETR